MKQSISEILPYRNGCAPFHQNRKNPATSSQVYGIRSPRTWRKNRPKLGFFTSKQANGLGGFSGGCRIFTRFSPTPAEFKVGYGSQREITQKS
ncbi:hypothetical protein [Scytonema sp. HK-05]|uniref:hypothetical protein n=1 Tax=Scytonema sp. HK-05 TaxID=1137095 RepID=UPI000937241F|nr:hypothetical protein [Scytonema sp. HK-05]OKH58647.1 hypothetical protein NIES2130_13325 [Scytonema sp. HK-05]